MLLLAPCLSPDSENASVVQESECAYFSASPLSAFVDDSYRGEHSQSRKTDVQDRISPAAANYGIVVATCACAEGISQFPEIEGSQYRFPSKTVLIIRTPKRDPQCWEIPTCKS